MTPIQRTLSILGCLLAVTLAHAQDAGLMASTKFVRLSPDRIVAFTKGSTFDFQRDAAWDLPDAKQKIQFGQITKKAGLSKDPGQFVADLLPDKEIPLGGEIQVGAVTADSAELSLKVGSSTAVPITLKHATSWSMSDLSRDAFKSFASDLHTTTSTLLVLISGGSGKVSEEQALSKLLERSKSANGVVVLLGSSRLALWSHPKETATSSEAVPVTRKPEEPKLKPPANDGATSWILPSVAGGVLIALGVALGMPSVRRQLLPGLAKSTEKASSAFQVGTHERELILKVREEGQRKPPPLNAPYSVEEYAVGMMLDRYQGYDKLVRERDQAQKQAEALHAYKEYQEQYQAFEKRFVAATEALKQREAELLTEKGARKELQDKIQQAETHVNKLLADQAELAKSIGEAEALLTDTGEWAKSVTDRLNAQAAKIHHE